MIGDRELIRAAMEAAGVEDAGRPRHRVYVNPRHQPVEEPAEQVEQEQQETPEKPKTTSTLPIPTGDPGPRLPATGGSEPFRLEIDTRKEAREHADRLWLQMTGQVPPTPISGPVEGRLV